MSRTDQYSLTLAIDGEDFGVWDKLTGGDIDSSETKYKPGAMAPEVSLGGSVSVSDLVIDRLYVLDRDHVAIPGLVDKVGKGQCTIVKQPLDLNKNAFGKPIVYTGVLKTLNLPDADSEGTAAALITLTVSAASTVS